MQARLKKLAIILLIGYLLLITINTVSADDSVEVSNYTELNGNVSAGNNVVLKNNITDGIFDNGIIVDQSVTVNGNGYCIDAKQTGRIFKITNSSAILTLINITLINGKTIGDGGAIWADGNVNIIANDNVCFNNNTASIGGAIYTQNGMVNITSRNGTVTFKNNKASTNGGGAIRALGEVTIQATEDIIFTNNFANSTDNNKQGGAGISAYKYLSGTQYEYYNITLISTNGKISFRNNTASGSGGAIHGGNVSITANIIEFSNNTVTGGAGGAIISNYGSVVINATGNVNFNNNTATGGGGAILAVININITTTNGNIYFYNNTAIVGGAIYAVTNVNITTNGNVYFYNNTAIGGAIYAGANVNIITTNGSVCFYNNNATGDGGAISANGNVTITTNNGDMIFYENTADNGGGAIYANDGDVIINSSGNICFNNNTASKSGGAICTYTGNVIITTNGNITFYNNTARNDGGAIYTNNDVNITTNNGSVSFCNNTAVRYGGSIYTNTIHINKIILIFNNNTASTGKNIYIKDLENSNIDDCFWGLNYKSQQQIKDVEFIYLEKNGNIAPDSWLLLNIVKPDVIAADINNTFKLVINQRNNNGTIEDIESPFIAYIPVKLSNSSNVVPSIVIGYFNFTTDHAGNYVIHVRNIFNDIEISNLTFTVDNSPFSKVAEFIKDNTTVNLEKDYNYYQELDYKLAKGIKITRNTTINGNGYSLDAKNLATIFQVNKGVTLTLKNIRLLNANIAIVNNGVLDLTNVTSKSAIRNNGVITSGVKFIVYSDKVTTYDSYLVSLRTVDGIPIMVSNLKYSDDQGHNYKAYIYNKGFYVNYVPEGITGHVTFNNVKLNGFTNLTSEGNLDITKYPKTSNNIVKSVSTNIINNPVVKNINSIIKNTIKDIKTNIFKLIRA